MPGWEQDVAMAAISSPSLDELLQDGSGPYRSNIDTGLARWIGVCKVLCRNCNLCLGLLELFGRRLVLGFASHIYISRPSLKARFPMLLSLP